MDERLLAPTIVVFDGLRHGSEMEEDATQRPLRFGEELHSVVEQRRDGLTARVVEELLPRFFRKRLRQCVDRIRSAEEREGEQLGEEGIHRKSRQEVESRNRRQRPLSKRPLSDAGL